MTLLGAPRTASRDCVCSLDEADRLATVRATTDDTLRTDTLRSFLTQSQSRSGYRP
jgi:hypothetical protein